MLIVLVNVVFMLLIVATLIYTARKDPSAPRCIRRKDDPAVQDGNLGAAEDISIEEGAIAVKMMERTQNPLGRVSENEVIVQRTDGDISFAAFYADDQRGHGDAARRDTAVVQI